MDEKTLVLIGGKFYLKDKQGNYYPIQFPFIGSGGGGGLSRSSVINIFNQLAIVKTFSIDISTQQFANLSNSPVPVISGIAGKVIEPLSVLFRGIGLSSFSSATPIWLNAESNLTQPIFQSSNINWALSQTRFNSLTLSGAGGTPSVRYVAGDGIVFTAQSDPGDLGSASGTAKLYGTYRVFDP